MNTILINYDLRSPEKNYQALWDHLQTYSGFVKPLESLWLIKTGKSAKEVRDTITNSYIDSNDRLLVINITSDAAAWGGLTDKHSMWIKDNI